MLFCLVCALTVLAEPRPLLPDPMINVLCWSCSSTDDDPRLCRFLPELRAMGANMLDLINPQWIDPNMGRPRLGLIDPALRARVLQRSRASIEELHAAGLSLHGSLDTGAFRPDSFAAAGLDPEAFYGRAPDGSVMEAYEGKFFDKGAYLSCFNNPDWRSMMVRQVKQLAGAGFDGVRWDSYTYVTHPFGYACHCRHCRERWRRHCLETRSREEPLPKDPLNLDDPAARWAMRWRWDCFVEYIRAVKEAVRAEHPSFVFSANLGAALPDSVHVWRSGVLDMIHTEEWWHSLPPFYDGYGCQLMRAAAPDRPAVTLHNCREPWTAARVRVGIAEALANGAVWQGGSLCMRYKRGWGGSFVATRISSARRGPSLAWAFCTRRTTGPGTISGGPTATLRSAPTPLDGSPRFWPTPMCPMWCWSQSATWTDRPLPAWTPSCWPTRPAHRREPYRAFRLSLRAAVA